MRIVRPVLARLALLTGGSVLAIALLEGALQAGAFLVRVTGWEPPSAWQTDRLHVLCVGESTSASRVRTVRASRASFRALLEAFAPDLVLVMVGVNDYWTRPVLADASDEWTADTASGLRVVRLLRLLGGRISNRPGVELSRLEGEEREIGILRFGNHVFRLGFERADGGNDGADEALARSLEDIVATARAHGADPV